MCTTLDLLRILCFLALKVGEITCISHKYLFEHVHNTWPTQNPVFYGSLYELLMQLYFSYN